MVVSGLLVNIMPEKLDQVKDELLRIHGVEVNRIIDDYKVVVVIESNDIHSEVEISRQISKMDGVLGINLAYHHFDDDEE